MNKINYVTLIVGVLLAVIFGLLLFTFQVRQTEVALVTTFGKPTRDLDEPGLYGKWPWPVQRVLKFDKRTQSFADKLEETQTEDGRIIQVMIYLGWGISDPAVFRERFDGSISRAEDYLRTASRTAKLAAVGRHPFSHFVSTDPEALRFSEIEREMLDMIQPGAGQYGMDIQFLGIKRLSLPESVTENVFERMRAERQVEVERLHARGQEQAASILTAAERDRRKILDDAEAQAKVIQGQAEAEAAQYYSRLQQNPDLALFLEKLQALELSLKRDAHIIMDRQTPPLDVLNDIQPMPTIPSSEPDAARAAKPVTGE